MKTRKSTEWAYLHIGSTETREVWTSDKSTAEYEQRWLWFHIAKAITNTHDRIGLAEKQIANLQSDLATYRSFLKELAVLQKKHPKPKES